MELMTIIITALNAGFYFAWSVTVIPGTKKISDKSYLETMKSINKEIMNPAFFILFFGPAPLLIYNAANFNPFQVAAAITYLIGPIGITMFKNVPLNDKLDAQDLASFTEEKERNFRKMYEQKWNRWHYIRTTISLLSFVLVTI